MRRCYQVVARTRPEAHADWKVTIEGHTDSTSTHDHNQTLSEKRAAAVKAYLVKAGIAADRLDTAGLAETKPIAPNTDALGRAQNRRVELAKR
jgi:outer membrane protein OmpA-like peptidoglycan-associated protein